jgi:ATP-dependent Zn protease
MSLISKKKISKSLKKEIFFLHVKLTKNILFMFPKENINYNEIPFIEYYNDIEIENKDDIFEIMFKIEHDVNDSEKYFDFEIDSPFYLEYQNFIVNQNDDLKYINNNDSKNLIRILLGNFFFIIIFLFFIFI